MIENLNIYGRLDINCDKYQHLEKTEATGAIQYSFYPTEHFNEYI